ncbi:hypothetical protein PPSIR1_37869 [Plesiocystis pacifica SIR-1]|uniref:Methyltransferase type 11 domain-containing protein n=2 Tax=Plesiocystis pacifica TaxID=191768 RepID=A6G9L3_9BACT|nr:hypothetical protein PPSIR1_37869 [Plesiocystis pacifica SIR-1]
MIMLLSMFPRFAAAGVIAALVLGCAPTPTFDPASLDDPQRSEADRERDARSRPAEVVPFLALEPGDQVLDFLTGGGYYAHILAGVVGPQGRVLAHNNAAYHEWVGPDIDARFEAAGLSQVMLHERELDDLGLAPGSLDAALMVACFHDLYFVDVENDWPAVDADRVMAQIAAALAPKGRLVVVDHLAGPGRAQRDAQALHRIEPSFVVEAWEAHGLRLVERSEVLFTGRDQLDRSVFDPEVRGRTDRFILVFERDCRRSPCA